ncbi:hypothetical protein NECID01_0528 [Nematocida sp. AWRm77]|nr:hypothetical protein NECID01_0528 [Nematocida sp. AWRm77]
MAETRMHKEQRVLAVLNSVIWALNKLFLPFDAKFLLYFLIESLVEGVLHRSSTDPSIPKRKEMEGTNTSPSKVSVGANNSSNNGSNSSDKGSASGSAGSASRSASGSSGGSINGGLGGAARRSKVAVVIDGASEKGSLVVERLAAEGYFVLLPGRENRATEKTQTIRADMKREESAEAFIKKVQKAVGRVDLLIVSSTVSIEKYTKSPKEISGMEKKMIPSRKKVGFVTKKEQYREADRNLLEKDPNIRRNYLINFLVICGLARLLKAGDGRVVVCVSRAADLVSTKRQGTLLPSMFYSFCYSQMCGYLLGIGAKARFSYLDVSVVSTGYPISDIFNFSLFRSKLFQKLSVNPERYARTVLHAAEAKKTSSVSFFDGLLQKACPLTPEMQDRANDLWEQAEIIS